MKIAIIGSGWYGCYIYKYIKDNFKNIEITIFEKENKFFNMSSYKNQNRLHLGFHYPRHFITRNQSNINFDKFNKLFNLTEPLENNYYIISKKSIIDYKSYLSVFSNEKIEYTLLKNNIFSNTDGCIINTKERYINFNKVRNYFFENINKNDILCNTEISRIYFEEDKIVLNKKYKFDKVINCTYGQLSIFKSNFFYEKCLVLIYEKVSHTDFDVLTIMDGPFSSIFKYKNNLYTLTDVEYTPIKISDNFSDVENYELSKKELNKLIQRFENKISFYFRNFRKCFKYHSYFYSFKTKTKSNSDSRDLNFKRHKNYIEIMSGKISLVFETDKIIDKLINDS